MKRWFRDVHFRSLLKNSGYLAASRGVAAVCGLATLALAGRGLGAALFGVLVLIHSYALAASGIAKFQSWQLVIRYGGPALARGEDKAFKDATGFAFALDIVSGLVGMIIAIALLPLLGPWFGIRDDYLWMAMLYCTLLPTMAAATPTGVLRALDRFDLISWQGTVNPIARAVLTLIAWWHGLSFPFYVAIWFATDLGGDLFLWFLAWRELKRRSLFSGIRPALRPSDLPGAWAFAVKVNLTTSLSAAWGPVANLLVGGILGPVAAGLYRIAKSLADSIDKPSDLLGKAFYPEVVRLDFSTKRPWRLMLRGTVLSAVFAVVASLIIIFCGKLLIETLFGPEFSGAFSVLLVMLVATFLTMITFPIVPMLYALDRPGVPLAARACGAIAYLLAIYPLATWLGIVGAGVAFVIGNAVDLAIKSVALQRQYVRVRVQ